MRRKEPAKVRVRNIGHTEIYCNWPGAIFDLSVLDVENFVERGQVELITDEDHEDVATHPRWTIEK